MLLKLPTGACETCPSSTTTMKMGIERVLKEKFGDQIKDIVQVFEEEPVRTTVDVSLFPVAYSVLRAVAGCQDILISQ